MKPILRSGLAFALTIAIGYVACTAFFAIFPEASVTFMNALFHGLDFRKLQPAGGGFDVTGFAIAGLVLAGWGFMLGCIFAGLVRYFEGSSRVTA